MARAAAAAAAGAPQNGLLGVASGAGQATEGARGMGNAGPSPMESLLRGGADGATFGFVDEGGAIMAIDPIRGAISGDWGNQYDQNLARIRAKQEAAQAANPALYMGGQVAGSLPSLWIPGAAPVRGAGLVSNGLRMGGAGAAVGALYGVGSGDSLSDRTAGAGQGALIGGGLGAVTPVMGRGLGAAWSGLTGRGAGNGAANLAARAAVADNLGTPQDIANALGGYGPQAMAADLGPNLQRQAAALASTPGDAQAIVRDALTARAQGANGRIINDVNSTLGPARIPSEIEAGIRGGQQALSPEYQAALQGATAVDTRDIALLLDSQAVNLRGAAQGAVQKVRRMLNVTGEDVLDPNPGTLLETRKAIDGLLATEADPNAVRALTVARQRVDEILADAAPGIKDVDAKFAELARQREALQTGQQVLDSGRTAPRPTELQAQVDQGAIPQGNMVGPSAVPMRLREGARAEIERIVGTTSNDVVALQRLLKGEGSWNRDRLATLFGPERADHILQVLQRERAFADTASVVMRNSETAARLAAQSEIQPQTNGAAGVVQSLLNLKAGDAAARSIGWATGTVGDASRNSRNAELARLLTAQGPQSPAIQSVADAIAARNRRLAIEQGANLAIGGAGRGVAPVLLNSAP